jgi:alpha-tubulin suppressor-like RCC1 family protein
MPVVLGTDSISITGTDQTSKFDTYLRDTVGTTNNLTGEPTISTANIEIASVASGDGHTIILDTSGKVYAVGRNTEGQLGLGDLTQRTTPVPITYFNNIQIAFVSCGSSFTIFLDTVGNVYSVGNGSSGQLGLGNNNNISTPAPIPYFNFIQIKSVFAGANQTFFLDIIGKIYAVGNNGNGQLGFGDTTQRTTPAPIPYFNNIPIASVSSGGAHTIFLDTVGKVYAVGLNTNGQLGLGDTTQRTTPVPIPYFNTILISSVFTGEEYTTLNHTIFIDTIGRVYAVGINSNGQLGLGDTTQRTIPVQIPYFNTIPLLFVSAGGSHTVFLDTTGKVYSVGLNTKGQLGLGDTTQRTTPVQIPYFNNITIKSIPVSTQNYTTFIDTTGKVYSVGDGGTGQLGLGTTTDISTPAPITYFTVTPTAVTATEDGTLANHKLFTLSAAGYYLLSFPAFTIVNINSGDDIALNGTYKVIISSTRSSVLPVVGNVLTTVAFPQTASISSFVIRYHLRIPTLVPKQFVIETVKSVGTYNDIDGEPTTDFKIATFTHNGGTQAQTSHTFIFPVEAECELLVVAGGGGGGGGIGGGGGAGAVVHIPMAKLPTGTYTIQVGNGGASSTRLVQSSNGTESFITGPGVNIIAEGGGGVTGGHDFGDGKVGGSGGGAAGPNSVLNTGGAAGTSSSLGGFIGFIYGNKGGSNTAARNGGETNATGGGGAGGAAIDTNPSGGAAGHGGIGKAFNITGSYVFYGGGGGGGGHTTFAGLGGAGGGGNGSHNGTGSPGQANTGGGGGGGAWETFLGGAGGSGIVIIRYKLLPTIINNDLKYLAFPYISKNELIYDFTNDNTETAWRAKANSIQGFTFSFNIWFESGIDGIWSAGDQVGFFQYELPSSYNTLTVSFGNILNSSEVRLLINGVIKSTATASQAIKTYTQSYNPGDILRVEELYAMMSANIIITLSDNTQTYTINFPVPTICDILVVGGGGGGGGGHGGGGGAGQLVFINNATLNGTYNIKVGNGGSGGTFSGTPGIITFATKGSNSEFGNITTSVIAEGGGANAGNIFKDGGSGAGGDSYTVDGEVITKGLKNTLTDTFLTGTVYSRGNDGGTGVAGPSYGQGAGGGGAGSVGGNGGSGTTNASPGNGGDGLSGIIEIGYDFKTNFGTNVGKLESDGLIYFAGGGGGGGWDISAPETNSIGGKGGGGAGGLGNGGTSSGIAAVNNTGSGGGGGSANYGRGASGGSGIVIIRFPRTKIPFDAQWTYSASNTNVYHLGNVGIGTTNPTNALHVIGNTQSTTYSANSKTFKIEHPLKINKWLYHGCLEAPRFDNIYRGKKLVTEGKAEVDIDTECNTTGGMTPGTFPILNTNTQLFLRNNQTYDRVKGKISGSTIRIECENTTDDIEIDWMVVGERHDEHVINTTLTDSDGNLICEHEMPVTNVDITDYGINDVTN